MKKLSILFLVLLCLLSALTTSCSLKHSLTAFKEKIDETESYQFSLVLIEPTTSTRTTLTTLVEGNVTYFFANDSIGFDEYFVKTIDEYEIIYQKDSEGNWTKSISEILEEEEELPFDVNLNDIFNADNYESVKGEKKAYKQKKDVVFGDFDDLLITFGDNTCTIEGKAMIDGIMWEAKIIYSKVGEVDLTLPTIE